MSQTNQGNRILTTDPYWQGPSVGAHQVIGYAGTVMVDFAGSMSAYQTVTLSGNIHFDVMNMAGGANNHGVSIRVIGDGSDRLVGYNTDIKWLGTAPGTQAANKVSVASFTAYGTLPTDVVAVYAKQR